MIDDIETSCNLYGVTYTTELSQNFLRALSGVFKDFLKTFLGLSQDFFPALSEKRHFLKRFLELSGIGATIQTRLEIPCLSHACFKLD